ncbi:MBL fold metallo-hydrolase [Candidatus Woesearchaeota archaeon]|nr:MBL fold metallo-hydrolase [Candidatus Woesearchaeota archaeon]
MSKILFLGTAGDATVVSKQLRASGGIILELEGMQFHLDPGPGALVKAKEYGISLQHTTAILVSNNSLPRCNDLNAVIDAMTHGGLEHRGIVLGSKSVFHGNEESHPFLTKRHQQQVEKVIPLEKNHKVGIEFVEINSVAAEHDDPHALGFKFLCPKFTLSYTGDTELTSQLLEQLTGTDILILNVRYPGSQRVGKHLDTASAAALISHIKPRIAVMTHFGFEMLKADPLGEAREVQRLTGVQTIAATDGLVVSPGGYGKMSPVVGY